MTPHGDERSRLDAIGTLAERSQEQRPGSNAGAQVSPVLRTSEGQRSEDDIERKSSPDAKEPEDLPDGGIKGWICVASLWFVNAHTWGINAVCAVKLASGRVIRGSGCRAACRATYLRPELVLLAASCLELPGAPSRPDFNPNSLETSFRC